MACDQVSAKIVQRREGRGQQMEVRAPRSEGRESGGGTKKGKNSWWVAQCFTDSTFRALAEQAARAPFHLLYSLS